MASIPLAVRVWHLSRQSQPKGAGSQPDFRRALCSQRMKSLSPTTPPCLATSIFSIFTCLSLVQEKSSFHIQHDFMSEHPTSCDTSCAGWSSAPWPTAGENELQHLHRYVCLAWRGVCQCMSILSVFGTVATSPPTPLLPAGHVEDGDMNAVQFEDQMRTFSSRGYAMDPSISHQMTQK